MTTSAHTATALTVGAWRVEAGHSSAGFEVREFTNRVARVCGRLPDHEAILDLSPMRSQ